MEALSDNLCDRQIDQTVLYLTSCLNGMSVKNIVCKYPSVTYMYLLNSIQSQCTYFFADWKYIIRKCIDLPGERKSIKLNTKK